MSNTPIVANLTDENSNTLYPITKTNAVYNSSNQNVDDLLAGKLAIQPDGSHNLLENNKINTTYLPDYLLGQLLYGGTVTGAGVATLSTNAKSKLGTANNSITLSNDTTATTGYGANEGIYYVVSSDGSFASLGLLTGDWLISTGSAWKKIDNTDAVSSVNGKTGAVTLTASDVGALSSGTSYVSSINGSTGAITKVLKQSSTTTTANKIMISTSTSNQGSWSDLKTINGSSLIGSGNISISSGSGNVSHDDSVSTSIETTLLNNYYTKNETLALINEIGTQLYGGGGSDSAFSIPNLSTFKYLRLQVKVNAGYWYSGVISTALLLSEISLYPSTSLCWVVPGVSSSNTYGRAWVNFTANSATSVASIGASESAWIILEGVS